MSQQDRTAARDRVWKVVYEGTHENMNDLYKNWASTYDKDLNIVGYKGAFYGAVHLARELGDRKHAKILDVAAGSGMVAIHLKELGFDNIDGLDGSQHMLDVAKEKNLYIKYICAFVGADRIPGIETDEYDSIVCAGGFGKGHLQPECLQELIRLVKPGGVIVLLYREDLADHVDEYKHFDSVQKSLVDAGCWEPVRKERIQDYYPDKVGTCSIHRVKVSEVKK